MKKILHYLLLLVGFAALLYITGEPAYLDARWLIGELVGMCVMCLCFRAACSTPKR